MRKTRHQFWAGVVLLTPALALADAEHGGLELSSLTVVRTNSSASPRISGSGTG